MLTPQASEVSRSSNSFHINSNPKYSLISSSPLTTSCRPQSAPIESTSWVTWKSTRRRFMSRGQSSEWLITPLTTCRPTCNNTHWISSLNILTRRTPHAILNTITNRSGSRVASLTKPRFSSTSAFLHSKKSYTSLQSLRALKSHGFNMWRYWFPACTSSIIL